MSHANPDESSAPPRSTVGGAMAALQILRLLGSASDALFAQAGLHAQLARMEWQQEKRRLASMLVLGVFATLCVGCMLLALGALALIAGWDSGYRVHIAAALCAVYLVLAGIAWFRIAGLAARGDGAFAATRVELAADLAMLRSRLP